MATKEQMAAIRAQRVDSVARRMMQHGVSLTWAQADEIGDEGTGWLRTRLGLVGTSSDNGVEYAAVSR